MKIKIVQGFARFPVIGKDNGAKPISGQQEEYPAGIVVDVDGEKISEADATLWKEKGLAIDYDPAAEEAHTDQ